MGGKTIISIIVACVGYMAITKWMWTPKKRDQNSTRQDDSASAEALPPLAEKDDLATVPSSSSAESRPPAEQRHDVFLSFRGPDTRKGITTEICLELQKRGVKAFMDDQDLVKGSSISPSLLKAIEESRFAIVVLSQNYASSSWCLEELTKIVQCMEKEDRILPLFYDVEPCDVRYQTKSYEVAFKEHEEKSRHETTKLNQWRDALRKLANLSGWDSKNFKSDRELVKDIVESVYGRLRPLEFQWSMSTGDFEIFGSTREVMDKVMEALKDDEINTIGVYGMGGVGKTTLVKNVSAQACKIGIFNHVIMAAVSQNPDLITIQGTLADLLGVKLEEQTEMRRAHRLHKEIMSRKNLLIILDDIWKILELSRIGIPSYDKLKTFKSKVLLTTRRLQVCHSMECQASISLNILSEEDSWSLFVKKTRKSFEKSSKFYGIAREVSRECFGLPIALITVARALGDKDIVEWKKASQRLKKSQVVNPDDEGDAFECIKLSYDYLKDEDCKSCFLLCCLFPEDYHIEIEDLFKYGYGKGLFRDADTIKEAKETADSVVLHLKNSSLLMDSRIYGCVRMHDVIRDTATQIVKDEYLVRAGNELGYHWPNEMHESCTAFSLMGNNITHLPKRLVFPKLQILLLQRNMSIKEIPKTFVQSLDELRVLDLSHTSISSLPRSWSLLTNLQSLHLDFCDLLDDISIVGKLEKLQILSMRYYNFKILPREIGDLINLKIFDITDAKVDRIPSYVISKLHRLEELYMRCDFQNWGKSNFEGEEPNANFEEVTALRNLTVLEVRILDAECIPKTIGFDPNWVKFDITIGKYTSLRPLSSANCSRYVEIKATTTTLPEWFFNLVTFKAEALEWRGNLRLIDVFVGYKHGWFQGLKHLSTNKAMPWEVPVCHVGHPHIWLPKDPPVLENLEVLQLKDLHSIEELHLGELPPGSLLNLKELGIHGCENWGNVLFPAKLLKSLPNLQKLSGGVMRVGTEYVFECEDTQPVQTKLREMDLYGLEEVRSICSGPAPRAMFQTLVSLTIDYCHQLSGSLFTSDIAQCLHHLETFHIWDCPLIQRIFEASNKKYILPKLKRLNLYSLPELCYDSATIDFECPSLEQLHVNDCPQCVVSISDFHSNSSSRELDES